MRRRLQGLQALDDANGPVTPAHAPHRTRVTGVQRLAQLSIAVRVIVGAQEVGAEQIRRHARHQSVALQECDAACELLRGAAEARRDNIDDISRSE